MAYSPLDEGPLAKHPAIAAVATRLGVSAAEVALAWTIRRPGVCTIPKAAREEHVRAARRAADLALDAEALAALDRAFPPPRRKRSLEVI